MNAVPWFTALPQGWSSRRVKTLTPVFRGASPRPIDDPIYFDEDGEYAWVRISDVTGSDGFLLETTQRLSAVGSSRSVKLDQGELFLSIAGSVGKPCITGIKACIHDGFVYFPRLPKASQRFLYYIFESGQCFSGIGKLGTQLNLNTSSVGSIEIPFPSLETQRAITDFLDIETARIDQLVSKKQQEIALLDEELRSFISAAVTGADYTGPVKQSPYCWLPRTPGHWITARLKFLCQRIVDCLHETPEHSEIGEYPSIRTADVERGRLLVTKAKRVSASEYAHRIQRLEPAAGDVLYTREGERFGLAAVVPENTPLCLGQRMMMFRVNDRIRPEYLMWSLNGEFAYHYLRQSTAGATSPHLNIFDIRNVPIMVPPLAEQDEIVSRIEKKAIRQWRLADLIGESVERLYELRSALVNEIVTGRLEMPAWRKRGVGERRIDAIEVGIQV